MAHTAFNPTLTPLSNHFGVEVEGIDLTKLTTQEQFQRFYFLRQPKETSL